jgi:putative membrane protein
MRRPLPFLAAAAAGALLATAAPAQEPGSRQTREFVQAAAESDTFELMEAYSALALSKDAQVLAFAQQMIRDHSQTSRTLQAAATQAGLKPPVMQVGAGQTMFLASLQSARGRDFDKTYWKQQALAHRSALVTEQQYAASGDAPAVRQAAQAAIPLIQAHLAMAEQMVATLGDG